MLCICNTQPYLLPAIPSKLPVMSQTFSMIASCVLVLFYYYLDRLILGNFVNLRLKEKNSQGRFSNDGILDLESVSMEDSREHKVEAFVTLGEAITLPVTRNSCSWSADIVPLLGGGGGDLGSGKPPPWREIALCFMCVDRSDRVMLPPLGNDRLAGHSGKGGDEDAWKTFAVTSAYSTRATDFVPVLFLRQSQENPNLFNLSIRSGVMLEGLSSCQNLYCRRCR